MKTRIFFLIGTLLLVYGSAISQNVAAGNATTREGTINVFSSPDLYNLTLKWTAEYRQLNPRIMMNVVKVPDGRIGGILKPGTGIGFISHESDPVLQGTTAWNMVVGRDVIIPVMNSRNPFLDEINRNGVSPAAFARFFGNPAAMTWGTLLGNDQQVPVHCYIVNDPSVISCVSDFAKTDQGNFKTMTVENGAALATALRNDPNAIGFCRMVSILDATTQNLGENIRFLPIDKNGNGSLDYMEKIYADIQTFSRGVWIGKYPKALSGNIYAVSAGQPASENETAFLTWVLADGQRFLGQEGFSDLVGNERQTQLDKLNFMPVTSLAGTNNWYDIVKIILLIVIAVVVIGSIVDMVTRPGRTKKQAGHGNASVIPDMFDENSVTLPKGLFFDKTHTWAYMEKDGSVKIGIDDFLQHITGPISSIGMKPAGVKIKKGDPLLTIIQNGKHLLLYSPVSGTITANNRDLSKQSSTLNTAPYTDGWVYTIEPTNWLRDIQFLSMAEKYETWLKDEFSRLKDFLSMALSAHTPEYATVVMQDGGVLKDSILADLGPKVWEDFQTNFIDTAR